MSHPHTHHSPRRTSDSTGGLFRPFDDDMKPAHSNHQQNGKPPQREIPPPLYSRSSIKQSQQHQQLPKRPDLSSSVTLSKSSDILTIPSVKVHPQRHGLIPVDNSLRSTSRSDDLTPVNQGTSTSPRKPQVSPQFTTTKVISNCISNRIERFDFKSLARECTTANLNEPGEKVEYPDIDLTGSVNGTHNTEYRLCQSKLDLEEKKLRNKRKRWHEADDEEEREVARLTIIGRVTPLPLETPPEKMQILEYLGVTTLTKKEGLFPVYWFNFDLFSVCLPLPLH